LHITVTNKKRRPSMGMPIVRRCLE